jgi:cell division protein FtsB
MRKHLKLFLALFLIIQIVFIKIIAQFPEFVERFYTYGLYQFISKSMRFVFGWIPFSVGDLIYTIAGIYIIRWLIINRKRVIKDTKNWILDVLAAVSIGYFAFHLFWAFNYYRLPLHRSLQIKNDYTTEQLVKFTEQLINRSNAIQIQITDDDSVKVEIPYSKRELISMTPIGYKELAKEFPHLSYHPVSLKRSIYSLPLTYMGFSGYLNPFTNEAQIDGLIPTYKYPTTCSHEIAHQFGYAAENEANFIGSMAAMHHEDIYFQYSGYTFALAHCLNDLFLRDPEKHKEIFKQVNIGILKNYDEARQFWESYQNPSEVFFKNTYSGFLKANNQSGGIDSYSYVVALLVNYYEDKPF